MKRIVIFGASGTVGAGTLLECLDSADISEVICVLRRPTGRRHPKLREIIHQDFTDFAPLAETLTGIDGCLWAIGIPNTGLSEQRYTEITHDYALAAVGTLIRHSPQCTFVFISAIGADLTSRVMWARVKGRAEAAVLGAGFRRALVFRPGAIAARRGIRHNVRLYGWSSWFAPLLRPFGMATSTPEIGRAFVAAVLGKSLATPSDDCLDSTAINKLAGLAP